MQVNTANKSMNQLYRESGSGQTFVEWIKNYTKEVDSIQKDRFGSESLSADGKNTDKEPDASVIKFMGVSTKAWVIVGVSAVCIYAAYKMLK